MICSSFLTFKHWLNYMSLHGRSREALVISSTTSLCCYSSSLLEKVFPCWEGDTFFTCLIHGQAESSGSVTAEGYNPFEAMRHFQIKKGSSLTWECCAWAQGLCAPCTVFCPTPWVLLRGTGEKKWVRSQPGSKGLFPQPTQILSWM